MDEFEDTVPFDRSLPHSTEVVQSENLQKDTVILKTGNSYTSYTPVAKGGIFLRFNEISFSKHSVDCVMEIEMNIEGGSNPPFSQRIDLRSSSARKSLATDLNSAYGSKRDGFNWVLILNVVFNKIVKEIQRDQQPIEIGNMVAEEPSFLMRPFLQENSSNLLFAQSEAGKTWFAMAMAASLANGKDFLTGTPLRKGKTLFLDYEDDIKTFASRMHKICRGLNVPFKETASMIQYYKPRNSLRIGVEWIKATVEAKQYDLLIIDAGGDAAGGSPSDEEKVLDLFNALEEIPCTKLLLHHEPKNVQNESAAFYGSMYWKARSRVAWRLEVESQEGEHKLIKATIQKRSNLPYIEPIFYKMHFDTISLDEMFGDSLEPFQPQVRFEAIQEQTIQDKDSDVAIVRVLEKEGSLTANQIGEMIGKDASWVRKVLKYGRNIPLLVEPIKSGKGTIWRLKK